MDSWNTISIILYKLISHFKHKYLLYNIHNFVDDLTHLISVLCANDEKHQP